MFKIIIVKREILCNNRLIIRTKQVVEERIADKNQTAELYITTSLEMMIKIKK